MGNGTISAIVQDSLPPISSEWTASSFGTCLEFPQASSHDSGHVFHLLSVLQKSTEPSNAFLRVRVFYEPGVAADAGFS